MAPHHLSDAVSVPWAGERHIVGEPAAPAVARLQRAVHDDDAPAVLQWFSDHADGIDAWITWQRIRSPTDPLSSRFAVDVAGGLVSFWSPDGTRPTRRPWRSGNARAVAVCGPVFAATDYGAWMWECPECHAVEGATVWWHDGRARAPMRPVFVCHRCGSRTNAPHAHRVARALARAVFKETTA